MYYTMEQVKRGIAGYLDNEFMPMLDESPVKKLLVGTAISIGITKYAAMADILRENTFVKGLGVFDESGNVDVDTLLTAMKQNMPKEGVPMDIPGIGSIRLKEDDADKLMQYISQTAK